MILTDLARRRASRSGSCAQRISRDGQGRADQLRPPADAPDRRQPGGIPKAVIDGWQDQVATRRAELYRDLPAGSFYG